MVPGKKNLTEWFRMKPAEIYSRNLTLQSRRTNPIRTNQNQQGKYIQEIINPRKTISGKTNRRRTQSQEQSERKSRRNKRRQNQLLTKEK